MDTLTAKRKLDGRGKTITTFVVYEAARVLEELAAGEIVEIVTDNFEPFVSDISAWCDATGHRLLDTRTTNEDLTFVVEKGTPPANDTKLAMVISVAGLEELLSPLGFALGAALEGIEVHLYFQGPAVKVLTRGYQPKLSGWARPFTRFAASGMTKSGHISAHAKLRQLIDLGARIYVCGGSLQPFKVNPDDFEFSDLMIVEYLTFMSVMKDADIHIYT